MMNETNRSLQNLYNEIENMRDTQEDVKKSSYVLVRVTFILLITIIAGLIWG